MCKSSICLAENTVMLSGVLTMDSSRLRAVTMTSSNSRPLDVAVADCASRGEALRRRLKTAKKAAIADRSWRDDRSPGGQERWRPFGTRLPGTGITALTVFAVAHALIVVLL